MAIESFAQLDAAVRTTLHFNDGDECAAGATIGEITGSARALLSGERTALNFLQRLSGIATLARAFVAASGGAITFSTRARRRRRCGRSRNTRFAAGGATNHRMSLNDGVLIKDNHIRLGGGIARGRHADARVRRDAAVEVEVETLSRSTRRWTAGADILLLDNMTTADIREAVRRSRGRAKTEISGGVTLERIPELAATGADFVSSGALTHSAPAADISFEIEPA